MAADPKVLFALYHLGLDAAGTYQFRNLHQCARALKMDADSLQTALQNAGLDQDTVSRLAFNVARWHAQAQFCKPAEAGALIEAAWQGLQEARRQAPTGDIVHDVDYDDLWGDGHQGAE